MWVDRLVALLARTSYNLEIRGVWDRGGAIAMKQFVTTAIILLGIQHLASASSNPPEVETNNRTTLQSIVQPFSIHESIPELPPLGESSLYFPEMEMVHLVLRLSERRVYLYRGDRLEASYPVAVGKEGWETPTGNFEVIQLQVNPVWQSPWTGEVSTIGPNSPLGVRWIGFWTDGNDSIGFHGTPTVESIGQAASHGCVRMYNEDVVALFDQVEIGTPVVVEP